MILRWLHIIWKFLLRTITSVLIVTVAATLLLFALLQLPDSKGWLSDKIEQQFNQTYRGTLEIGEVTGLIPFHIGLTDVHIRSNPEDPISVLSADRITANVRVWSLLQRTVDIHSLELDNPTLRLSTDQEGQPVLRRTLEKRDPAAENKQTGRPGTLFELMAPAITIRNGHIESAAGPKTAGSLSPLLPLREVDASVYLELSSTERFLDISYITGTSSDERLGSFFIAGQLFSDNEFLELNGFQVRTPSSQLNFTAEATPVDLFGQNFEKQLREADFRFDLNESWIEGDAIANLVEEWPFPESMVRMELLLEGSLETLYLDRFIGSVGNSSLLMTGQFNQLDSSDFNWEARLENLLLHRSELEQLFREDPNVNSRTDYFSESRFYGQVGGTPDQLNGSLEINTVSGDFQLDGSLQFREPFQYEADAVLDSLDISPLFPGYLEQSLLDGRISLRGEGAGVEESQGRINISLNRGELNRIHFNQGTVEAEWADQRLEHQLFIGDERTSFRSTGSVGKRNDEWSLDLEGEAQNLDLKALYPDLPRSVESLSMDYRTRVQWSSPDDLAGQLSVEIEQLVMQPDTLQNHQFYIDINRPDETSGSRQLRLTSTFMDAEMEGDIYPVNLRNLYRHWHFYVDRHIQEDLLFSPSDESDETATADPAELTLSLELKEFSLLRHYIPSLPDLRSNSSIRLNLKGSAEELLLTGSLHDNGLEAGPFFAETIAADLTANFRYDDHLHENSTFDLQIRSTEYGWNNLLFHEGFLNSSLENDQLMLSHNTRNHENDFELDMTLISHLQPTEIRIELR
ncbi:MAG: AsmA family protein, partial [Balneolaceae bacterium]